MDLRSPDAGNRGSDSLGASAVKKRSMNFQLIGALIRLRYKLLWAKTRTRGGKIALFFTGYLLLVMTAMLFALGGLGAGMAAVRTGKGTLLAGALLGGIFAQAMLASVILGFGMSTIFSEME